MITLKQPHKDIEVHSVYVEDKIMEGVQIRYIVWNYDKPPHVYRHRYGYLPKYWKDDDIDLLTHEFSEISLKYVLYDKMGILLDSMIYVRQFNYYIHIAHLLVSMHTRSGIWTDDVKIRIVKPEEFVEMFFKKRGR